MEKFFKIILIIFIIFFAGIIVYTQKDFVISYFTFNPIIKSTMTGVIVKVNEHDLGVLGENGDRDLYWVSFGEEGNIGFKQGQEILIHYNGIIEEMFPARPSGVSKIKIIKEKSDKQIPESVINFFNNSTDENRFFYHSIDGNENSLIEMYIKDSTLTSKGATFILKNNTNEDYCYEPAYYIEKKIDNKWNEITLEEPLSWNSVIYTINAGEEIEINIDWSITGYGILENGEYRLIKTNFRKKVSPESRAYSSYTEFEIKD